MCLNRVGSNEDRNGVKNRNMLERRMFLFQTEEAKRLAREWMENYRM